MVEVEVSSRHREIGVKEILVGCVEKGVDARRVVEVEERESASS